MNVETVEKIFVCALFVGIIFVSVFAIYCLNDADEQLTAIQDRVVFLESQLLSCEKRMVSDG